MTCPKGEKPCLSRKPLPWSLVLIKICEVRVFGPAVANTTVPRVLLTLTGSSGILLDLHLLWTLGSPLIPNWATNPGKTRKIRHWSKKPCSVRSCLRDKRFLVLELTEKAVRVAKDPSVYAYLKSTDTSWGPLRLKLDLDNASFAFHSPEVGNFQLDSATWTSHQLFGADWSGLRTEGCKRCSSDHNTFQVVQNRSTLWWACWIFGK